MTSKSSPGCAEDTRSSIRLILTAVGAVSVVAFAGQYSPHLQTQCRTLKEMEASPVELQPRKRHLYISRQGHYDGAGREKLLLPTS